jgi:hypothetical protein
MAHIEPLRVVNAVLSNLQTPVEQDRVCGVPRRARAANRCPHGLDRSSPKPAKSLMNPYNTAFRNPLPLCHQS